MLSANTQKIVQCIQRSFSTNARSVAYALADPLQDEHQNIVHTGVQITKLDNGIKVASCDHGGPIARIALTVRGGSRFESGSLLGASHFLKNAAFSSNGGRTHLCMTREAQLIGSSVEFSNSRELMSWKGTALRTYLPEMLENIAPAVSSPLFESWDLGNVRDACTRDVASLDCTARNIEILHEVAYRTGLGNSVYCKELQLGDIGPGDLLAIAKELYVGARVTIAGTNCDHETLVQLSQDLLGALPSGEADAAPAQKYHGGEVRLNTRKGKTVASLVGPGAGLNSELLPAFAVLQRILCAPSAIPWGNNTAPTLTRAVGAATQEPFDVSSLNLSYSDAGLFGVHAVTTPAGIVDVLKAAITEVVGVANGNVVAEDVERAKTQLKAAVLMAAEESDDHLDDLVNQVALTGTYLTTADVLAKIDAVAPENIVAAALQSVNAISTLAVTGDSTTTPYLDELK